MDLLLCRLVCNLQVSVSPAFSGASPHQQKHSTPSLRLSFHFSRWSPACFVDVLSCVRRLLAPTFTLHGLWVRMPACLRNWNVFAQQKKNTGGLWSPAIKSPSSETLGSKRPGSISGFCCTWDAPWTLWERRAGALKTDTPKNVPVHGSFLRPQTAGGEGMDGHAHPGQFSIDITTVAPEQTWFTCKWLKLFLVVVCPCWWNCSLSLGPTLWTFHHL